MFPIGMRNTRQHQARACLLLPLRFDGVVETEGLGKVRLEQVVGACERPSLLEGVHAIRVGKEIEGGRFSIGSRAIDPADRRRPDRLTVGRRIPGIQDRPGTSGGVPE